MATYNAVIEYTSSIWLPLASLTSINKLQVMQNAALRTATGCTQDINIQHLHDETLNPLELWTAFMGYTCKSSFKITEKSCQNHV